MFSKHEWLCLFTGTVQTYLLQSLYYVFKQSDHEDPAEKSNAPLFWTFFFSLSRVIQPPWDTKCFIKLYFHKHALNLQTCVLWKQHCWGTLKQNIESLPTVNSNSNCVYIWANQFCPLGSNKNFKKRVLPKHRHWIRTYQRNVTTPNMES